MQEQPTHRRTHSDIETAPCCKLVQGLISLLGLIVVVSRMGRSFDFP